MRADLFYRDCLFEKNSIDNTTYVRHGIPFGFSLSKFESFFLFIDLKKSIFSITFDGFEKYDLIAATSFELKFRTNHSSS